MYKAIRQAPQARIYFFIARIALDSVEAGENADHVPIENRAGLVEGDAANCARSVGSYSGQLEDILKGGGKLPAMFREDDSRRLLHVANPRVITESLPQLMNLVRFCRCQRADRWQLKHPPVPEW